MRYLAIDYGLKRTGLALCDAGENISSPMTVLHGQKDLVKKILQIISQEKIEAVVIGLPLNMDGSEGPQSKRVREFGELLIKNIDIDVFYHDERLSSFEAQMKLAGQMTRKRKKERVDAIAAAEILQSFLQDKNCRQ